MKLSSLLAHFTILSLYQHQQPRSSTIMEPNGQSPQQHKLDDPSAARSPPKPDIVQELVSAIATVPPEFLIRTLQIPNSAAGTLGPFIEGLVHDMARHDRYWSIAETELMKDVTTMVLLA
jgi:hypothetical protein